MKGNHQLDDPAIGPEAPVPHPESHFVSLYCQKFGCTPRKFPRRFFLECVYPEARDLARAVNLVYSRCFREDYALIEDVKHTTSLAEFKKLVDFRTTLNSPNGLLRGVLKARLSKTRLMNVARTLFGEGG